MKEIHWCSNQHKGGQKEANLIFTIEEMQKVRSFHQTLPGYKVTPLIRLNSLAKHLGLSDIFVKDESFRFGLNSFKGLGSSYAIGVYLSKRCSEELLPYQLLMQKIKGMPTHTFATVTAGNHGRGVAWAAKLFGRNSVVYLPKGSSEFRLSKIRELGAQADITDLNYDDTVRFVAQKSQKNGWVLIQDTAWEGYTDTPILIMQGYLTIVSECVEQFKMMGSDYPTHVILQAGVGSFAGAIAAGLQELIQKPISIIIAEPNEADCVYQSGCSKDGKPRKSRGSLSTIMAGLSCGEVSLVAWDILKNLSDCFITCPDWVAANGMRILGNPMDADARVISGESGALPLGLLYELQKNSQLNELRNRLSLDSSSRVLIINTEGNTNPENYRSVCWEGAFNVSQPE